MTGRLSSSACSKSSSYVVGQRLVDGRAADLLDPQVRVRGLDRRRRVDAAAARCVGRVSASPVISTRTSTAPPRWRVDRPGQRGHLGQPRPAGAPASAAAAAARSRSSAPDRLVIRTFSAAGIGEAAVLHDPLGPAPLADRRVGVGLRARPGRAADRHAERDEREPGEHRPPAVLGAPPRHPDHPAGAPAVLAHGCLLPPRGDGRVSASSVPAGGRRVCGREHPYRRWGVSPPRAGRLAGWEVSVRVPTVGRDGPRVAGCARSGPRYGPAADGGHGDGAGRAGGRGRRLRAGRPARRVARAGHARTPG